MKLLIVASYNKGRFAPFVTEQAKELQSAGIEVDFFGIVGKGITGYLGALRQLRRKIQIFCPDIVHAHYGLSGLLCCLQRRVPVVVTYHGSDINNPKVLPLSQLAMRWATWNIFVSQRNMRQAAPVKSNWTLLPCGIDLSDDQLTDKAEARQLMGLTADKRYVLFAGAFDNYVKNSDLAKSVISRYNRQTGENCELIELKGYTRREVTLLMCAVDAFLLTSHTEGSPQVLKEAMACGCPVVSVDVGDVRERTDGLDGCYVANSYAVEELEELLSCALSFGKRIEGRERIIAQGLNNRQVAKRLLDIYSAVCPCNNTTIQPPACT